MKKFILLLSFISLELSASVLEILYRDKQIKMTSTFKEIIFQSESLSDQVIKKECNSFYFDNFEKNLQSINRKLKSHLYDSRPSQEAIKVISDERTYMIKVRSELGLKLIKVHDQALEFKIKSELACKLK